MAPEDGARADGSRPLQFSRNAFWNVLGQACMAALALLCTPFIVGRLGAGGYALYCLLGLIGGYLSLLAFGASQATVKYVAEFREGDPSKLAGVLGAAVTLHVAGVAAGALVVWACSPLLATRFFHVPLEQLGQATFVLACAAAAAPLVMLFQFGVSVLQGLERYDLANQAQLGQSGAVLAGAALLLAAGAGLRSIAVLYVAVQALAAGAAVWGACRLARTAPGRPFASPARARSSRAYVHYAFVCAVAALTYMVAFQFDKLFIGAMLPLSQLSYYLIPSAIMQKFGIVPTSIAIVALPVFSRLQAGGDHEGSRRIYRKCSQMILWIVMPGFAVLMIVTPAFLTLWLGEEFSRHGTWPMRFLLGGYFVQFLMALPANASAGVGRMRYNNVAGIVLSVLCCLFWPLLIPRLGIVGAALGFFLAQALSWLPFIFWVNAKLFGLSASSYALSVCLKPLLAGAALMAGLWLCRHHLYTWPSLIFLSVAGTMAYFGVTFRMLDADVRENLGTVFARARLAVLAALGRRQSNTM